MAVSEPSLEEVPSAVELTAVDRLKALGRGMVEWAKSDLKMAIIFMVLGAAISWIANIVLVAVVYDGVGKVPPGAPAVGTTNSVTGSIFWAVAMAVLFGLLSYRMSVGGPKFWRDLRDFPASLKGLLRSDGDTAVGHVLWGVAGSMIASAALSTAVSGVFAVGVLALLAGGLRPIVTGLLMLAWRRLIGAVVPDRKKPPTESTFSVVLLGVAAGLAAAYLITNPGLKVLAGVGAAALAFVLTRRQGGPSVAVFLVVLGGALLLALSHELRALAADGGWRENGGDPLAWLNGGGYGVITTSATAGLAGAGGTLAGSTVGGQPQPTEQELYDKYHQAYTKAHGGSDAGFDDWWRQSGFHQTTTMDNVRSLVGQASWLGNVPGQIWENGGTALGQAKDAFVKVFTGTVDSVKTAVDFYTSDSPQYQALRDMAAKEGIMPSLEDARQGFVDGVNKWADDMRTALANGDAATVQKMLAEFGGNMLGQAAMGQAGQTGLSMMAKSAQMQALSGLLNDAAASGNPLAKGLLTELNPGLTRGIQVLNTDITKLGGTPPGAPGPAAMGPAKDFPMNAEQQALANRDVSSVGTIVDENGNKIVSHNQTHKVTFDDGSGGCFKPGAGEKPLNIPELGDTPKYNREVGNYIVDRALGSDQVPTVAVMEHPELGKGSVSEWKPYKTVDSTAEFSVKDQEMAAVRDYVTGNVDQHYGNFGKGEGGRLVAPDGGETFPNSPPKSLRPSAFVADNVMKPLGDDVMNAVKSIDQNQLRADLANSGLSPQQIDGAMARLNEIAQNGKITGQTWTSQGGSMYNAKPIGAGFAGFSPTGVIKIPAK